MCACAQSLSRVWFFVTPQTLPTRLLCPWDFLCKIMEWVAIPFSRRSAWPRDWIRVSCIAGEFFIVWVCTYIMYFATTSNSSMMGDVAQATIQDLMQNIFFYPGLCSTSFWKMDHSSILKCIMEEGNGTPLQYSCLENSMDGGAWWAAVHGVARSRTWLSGLHFHFSLSCIGEGNGNPFQCSCLENPRDGEAWWAAIYGVAQSQTRLTQLSSSSSSKCIICCLSKLKMPVKHYNYFSC